MLPGPGLVLQYFPSFSEGLSLRDLAGAVIAEVKPHFPSFSEGLSLRGFRIARLSVHFSYFPSFSEGLSLRVFLDSYSTELRKFPFLFGGTFIEGAIPAADGLTEFLFPFLFGGTFIEGRV